MTQAMNKKINTYMMAAMMAVVSPAIMGQTASDGVKVICNDVVQKGDSIYIDAVVTVSGDAVKSRSYLELTPVLESASQKEGLPSILVNGRIRQKVYNREVALDNLNDVPHYTILKAGKEDQVVSYKTAVPFEDWMKDARVVLDPNLCGCGKEEAGSPLLIAVRFAAVRISAMRFSLHSLISRRWRRRRSIVRKSVRLSWTSKWVNIRFFRISGIMRWSWRRSIIRSVPLQRIRT